MLLQLLMLIILESSNCSKTRNKLFYDLINSFYKKTECPILINTSFNVRGEPIVCNPEDAFNCFINTDIDFFGFRKLFN